MNSFTVSIYLLSLLFIAVRFLRNRVGRGASVWVYFWLLFLMFSPGLILDVQRLFFWGNVGAFNITLLFILLIFTLLPWICFDTWYKNVSSITITEGGVSILSIVFRIVIISCLFSYFYIFPYALKSFSMGAAETRGLVNSDESVMPASIFTTFAVGVASISPFYIFLFFLSWLHPRLKKYSIWLFLSSFVYVVVSMPFMARDGFVTLPVFFIIFYLIFKRFINAKDVKRVKRYFVLLSFVAGSLLLVYSVSRFFDGEESGTVPMRLIDGIWGYIYQQPYVFDRTLNFQESWHGLSLRFPLLAKLLGQPIIHVERVQDFETMFGTMLSEFYSIGGYWPLFLFTFAFVFIYYLGIRLFIHWNNYFSLFLIFITYLMIEVSGLFYFRYGGLTFNWLFIILTLFPFFLNRRILIVRK